ncbi:MAG: NAD-binding protein [Clostridia bacterium]
MKILIAGGGNVGYYLVKTLLKEKHRILAVDHDHERCEQIAEEFSRVEVTCGDATDAVCLQEAGIQTADAVIAVTGQDQNNLVICQLAKDYFGVQKTIARVNNPKNIRVFEKLGVDSVVSSTAKIAAIIGQELDWVDVNAILKSKSDNLRMRMFIVSDDAFANEKAVSMLQLPKGMIIITIVRGDSAIVPNGQTKVQAGDEVILMGSAEEMNAAENCFCNARVKN